MKTLITIAAIIVVTVVVPCVFAALWHAFVTREHGGQDE